MPVGSISMLPIMGCLYLLKQIQQSDLSQCHSMSPERPALDKACLTWGLAQADNAWALWTLRARKHPSLWAELSAALAASCHRTIARQLCPVLLRNAIGCHLSKLALLGCLRSAQDFWVRGHTLSTNECRSTPACPHMGSLMLWTQIIPTKALLYGVRGRVCQSTRRQPLLHSSPPEAAAGRQEVHTGCS